MTRLQPALAEMSLEIRDLSLIYVMGAIPGRRPSNASSPISRRARS